MSPAFDTLVPTDVESVVAKLASSPIAAANSLSVSRSAGAESTSAETAPSV